jgi:hypothetical protein
MSSQLTPSAQRLSLLCAACFVASAFLLTGCGKNGHPQTPENSFYPLKYPAPTLGSQNGKMPVAYSPQTEDEALIESNLRIHRHFTKAGSFIDPSVSELQLNASTGSMITFGVTRSLAIPGESDNLNTDLTQPAPGQIPDYGKDTGTQSGTQ